VKAFNGITGARTAVSCSRKSFVELMKPCVPCAEEVRPIAVGYRRWSFYHCTKLRTKRALGKDICRPSKDFQPLMQSANMYGSDFMPVLLSANAAMADAQAREISTQPSSSAPIPIIARLFAASVAANFAGG
jgi:hypothetical protein